MAANLSVEIGLTGNAAQAAKDITNAFKEMGAAGDTATRSVQQLQEVANKPVGTGVASSQTTAQMVAGFERARQVMEEMQKQAQGMADVGLGAVFNGVAAGANEVREALVGAVAVFKDMIREGASAEEILAAMKEQAMGLPTGFERLSAVQTEAFTKMQAEIEATIDKSKQFQNVTTKLATDTKSAGKEFQDNEKAKQREIDTTTNAMKRQEQEEERQRNIRRTATQEMSRSQFGGAASTMMNISMGASMLGQGGLMGPIMGLQMMGTGLSEASAGATAFGASFAALIPILAAVAAAIGTVVAAVKIMQESIKQASEEQGLETRLKAVTGNAATAQGELQSMKSFVTGGAGGFMQLPDVAAGVASMQNLIGPAAANKDIMEGIAGSAVKAGKGYQEVATQVGAVIAKMQEGAPIRETGLIELQKEGILTADDVTQLGKMIKAHGDAATAVAMLTERLHQNAPAAEEMTNTWKGLFQQLSNVVNIQILAPIGQALLSSLQPAIQTLIPQLQNLGIDVAEGFRTGNFAPLIEEAISTAVSDGWKTAQALITEALPSLANTIASTMVHAIADAGTQITQILTDVFKAQADTIYNLLMTAFTDLTSIVGQEKFWMGLTMAIYNAGKTAIDALGQAMQNEINQTAGLKTGIGSFAFGEGGSQDLSAMMRTQLAAQQVTGQLGGEPKAKAAKQAKDDWSALTDAIKQAGYATKEASNQVQLYDTMTKAGMMTADQAAQAKSQAYNEEIVKLTDILPKLQQQEQVALQLRDAEQPNTEAWNKRDEAYQKAKDAVEQYSIKVIQAHADEMQLGTGGFLQNLTQGIRDATAAWGTFGQQTIELGKQITDQVAGGIGSAMTGLLTGTQKVGDAFKQMAISIIQSIDNMIAKLLVQWAVEQLLGLAGSGVSGISKIGGTAVTAAGSPFTAVQFKQTGGLVYGPTGFDKVPSALTAGEFVLTQRAVDKYGLAMINAMNSGTWQPGYGNAPAGIKQFASGGFVGSATSPANVPPNQNATGINTGQNIAIVTNVTVPGTAGTAPGGAVVGGTGGQGTLTPENAQQLQQTLSNLIRDEIVRQKRPGGLLSRQQLGG